MDYQTNQETNGKAIASMVLGILSIVIPYIGIVLGIIAIVLARKATLEIDMYKQNGKGMAIAGLTTGIVGVSLYGLIIFFAIFISSILY